MFILKKIITPFLLPPGIFILVLMTLGLLLIFVKNRRTGVANIAIAIAFWVACTAPFSNYLMENLESKYRIPDMVKGDVIILLGGGIIDAVPDFSGNGVPANEMGARILTAVRLQRKLAIPIIISGGKIGDKSSAEAPIVKRFLIDLGIKESKIILEEKSRDTYENAAFTKIICDEYAFKNPILITSAYHLVRSVESFKKAGLTAVPYPANYYALNHGEYGLLDFLPSAGSMLIASSALHEYIGLVFYRLVY
jgi:uncharacterized SAM-binding protein YcdF (DUF218 family)